MQNPALTENSFVRKLPFSALVRLSTSLDIENLWERLAVVIPVKPDLLFTEFEEHYELRYSATHIARFNNRKQARSGSSTKALLTDWGTQNCQIKHLVKALRLANLHEAADYIQSELLHQTPEREGLQSPSIHSGALGYLHQDSINSFNSSTSNNRTHSNNNSIISGAAYSEASTNHIRSVPGGISLGHESAAVPANVPEVSRHRGTSCAASVASGQTLGGDDRLSHLSGGNESEGLKDGAPTQTPTQAAICEAQEDVEEMEFSLPEGSSLVKLKYWTLKQITNNFDTRSYAMGGNVIGEGGFGTVFLGIFHQGYKVAIKCLKERSEDSSKQFMTEMEALCQFKHENLVQLLGYSDDGECPCLVYHYLPNGSLEDRLACRGGTPPLSNRMRLEICRGTARGIAFLHKGGLTHRDIKSANILLDAEFNAKVGDFATARVVPSDALTQTLRTACVIGTSAYLAPEARDFIIHPGLDSYSFGVVLLEVLTGLPVMDKNREEMNLRIYVQEHCSEGEDGEEGGTIHDLLDTRGGVWDTGVADALYSLSCHCVEEARKKRPTMNHILTELESLNMGDGDQGT